MAETQRTEIEHGILERLLADMTDKNSELEINLHNFSVKVPRTGLSLELSGLVTVSMRMRDLTASEKNAPGAKRLPASRA
jgi:hypothetical protein